MKNAVQNLSQGTQTLLLSLAMIAIGALLIWIGPSLSGYGALQSAWCHTAAPGTLNTLAEILWAATQHCPYCYVGAAFIGAGFVLPMKRD